MTGMNRREFLKYSVLACMSCSMLLDMHGAMAAQQGNYYLEHRQELVEAFRGCMEGVKQFLTPEFGAERAQAMAEQALAKYESLLPELPDVGGERNIDVEFVPIAAWYVALYEPLRANGKTAEQVGKLIFDLNSYSLAALPREAARAQGAKLFTPEGQKELREWADWTQERQYSANWVAHYTKGDGADFDYSIEYAECGVVKYLKSQNAEELAPYVCPNDFSKSRVLGTGLQRTKTIARGDGICNFRYKKDRQVNQDWNSELQLIKSRQS